MNVKSYRFSLSWKRFAVSWKNLDYDESMNETHYETDWDQKEHVIRSHIEIVFETLLKDGEQYYSSLIDGLISAGIEPMVTLYHWDMPLNIYHQLGCNHTINGEVVKTNGWTCPEVVDQFAQYAR